MTFSIQPSGICPIDMTYWLKIIILEVNHRDYLQWNIQPNLLTTRTTNEGHQLGCVSHSAHHRQTDRESAPIPMVILKQHKA